MKMRSALLQLDEACVLVGDAHEEPSPLLKEFVIGALRSAHNFCAARIRRKLTNGTSAEILLAEATETVANELRFFPSDVGSSLTDEVEIELEQIMRETVVRNYEAYAEVESYMWGLGIAGIFHQWERDTREVIMVLGNHPSTPDEINKMDFKKLCQEVEATGFDITNHSLFDQLRTIWLIGNTVKHGDGTASSQLLAEQPSLFHGGTVGVRMGNVVPQAHDLRVGESEFDHATTTIDKIWADYDNTIAEIISQETNNN